MAGNRAIANITFHKNATAPSEGEILFVTSDASTLNVDFVKGANTTFTAHFEGKVDVDSEWDSISAFNLRTVDVSTTATTDDTYQLDITGFSYIKIRLSAITGTISCYGKVVG